MLKFLSRGGLAGGLLAAFAAAAPAHAAPKTVDVATLHTLIDGLGLDDSGDMKGHVRIANQGSGGYTVYMSPTNGGRSVIIYTKLEDLAESDVTRAPLLKMLEYNDLHPAYFTVGTTNNAKSIYLQEQLTADAVTPQALRASLDNLMTAADETSHLWKAGAWTDKASAGSSPEAVAH